MSRVFVSGFVIVIDVIGLKIPRRGPRRWIDDSGLTNRLLMIKNSRDVDGDVGLMGTLAVTFEVEDDTKIIQEIESAKHKIENIVRLYER